MATVTHGFSLPLSLTSSSLVVVGIRIDHGAGLGRKSIRKHPSHGLGLEHDGMGSKSLVGGGMRELCDDDVAIDIF